MTTIGWLILAIPLAASLATLGVAAARLASLPVLF